MKAIAREKTFLIFQAPTQTNTIASHQVACSLTNEFVECVRSDSDNGSLTIYWQVVSHPLLSVQHLEMACTSPGKTLEQNTEVDPHQTFVLYSAQNPNKNGANDGSAWPLVKLDNKKVTLSYSTNCKARTEVVIQLVSIEGGRVFRNFAKLTSANPTIATITTQLANPSHASVLVNSSLSTDSGSGATTDQPPAAVCQHMARGYLDDTTLKIQRECISPDRSLDVSWQIIEWPEQMVRRSEQENLKLAENQGRLDVTTDFDQSRTFLWASGQNVSGQGGGTGTYNASFIPGEMVLGAEWSTEDRITFRRSSSQADSIFDWFFVELR